MDSVLEDIKETMGKLESTMAKADAIFDAEQRETYKRLLRSNFSPHTKVFTPGFLHYLSLILHGKPMSETRKHLRRETQDEENRSLEEHIKNGSTLVDTLPFSDLKDYYSTALEQGLEEANLLWMRRGRLAFGKVFKGTPLRVER